jgi:hypothetical protein
MRFLLLFAALTVSCYPKGQLTRTLHSPHQKYLDRLRSSLNKNPTLTEAQLAKGLPPECRTDQEDPLCLACEAGDIKVYRCYAFHGRWNAGEDCRYGQDFIKCLTQQPPFALSLKYRSSLERVFIEDLKSWVETIHQIWEDKLSPEERRAFDLIVSSLQSVAELVTRQTTVSRSDIDSFQHIFAASITPAEAELYLRQMSEDRTTGKLRLSRAIKGLEVLSRKTPGSVALFERFGSMNPEGPEE